MTPPLVPVLEADRWRDGRDGDAELVLTGVYFLRGGVVVSLSPCEVGVGLGAVADGDVGGVLLAIAKVAEFDGGADLAGGDVVRRDRRRP